MFWCGVECVEIWCILVFLLIDKIVYEYNYVFDSLFKFGGMIRNFGEDDEVFIKVILIVVE